MTQPVPLVLAVLLVTSSIAALVVRRLLWSLILLFYSSLTLGSILLWYGAVYAGLFHIVTFAGAVSVVFMVIIMLVGQDQPERRTLTPELLAGVALAILAAVPFVLLLEQLTTSQNRIPESLLVSSSEDELSYLWNFQSWNILFLLVPIAATILSVVNLFSKEDETE